MDRFEVSQAVTAANNLPVMEAWLSGKVVQYKDGFFSAWTDFDGESPMFAEPRVSWRVKPLPRRWWIVESVGGSASSYTSLDEARKNQADGDTVVEVLEVIR